jgi:hypothetical protein
MVTSCQLFPTAVGTWNRYSCSESCGSVKKEQKSAPLITRTAPERDTGLEGSKTLHSGIHILHNTNDMHCGNFPTVACSG